MDKEYRVTPEMLEASIVREDYTKLGTKMTACVLTLQNGHEVVGIAGVVDPSQYDINIGSKFAREKAIDQLWPLLGYAMQVKMYEDSKDIETAKKVEVDREAIRQKAVSAHVREQGHMGWNK